MIRIVTIIWRACHRLAQFYIGYLIFYKAFQSFSNLVHHFDGKAVNIEGSIYVQVLEVKAWLPVCKASGGSNVLTVVGTDVASDNSRREYDFLEGELVAVGAIVTRRFTL